MSIIISKLDTDLYKFSTSYAYMSLFPDAIGTFSFIDRNKTKYTEEFVNRLNIELTYLNTLTLTESEFEFMSNNVKYIPKYYWEWYKQHIFDKNKINITLSNDGELSITVTDYLYKVTLWEVPILALVSEIQNECLNNKISNNTILDVTHQSIWSLDLDDAIFSEFGTRRRFSYNAQDLVIKTLNKTSLGCIGTSNCHFAMKYKMQMIGTHPHEWFMFHGAIFGYQQANYLALQNWSDVYGGELGIALTDTYTSDIFFDNFSKVHAKLFDGIRQDSGNECEFIDKAIKRYQELDINPTTKTIVFSNSLTPEKVQKILKYADNRINCRFGIGTNLTNNFGIPASNIVMKLISCQLSKNKQLKNCVKLSDDFGKYTGNESDVNLCKSILNI